MSARCGSLGHSQDAFTASLRGLIGSYVARSYPDVRLLVLRGVGHVAQMERPQAVARAVLGMPEDLGARTA